MPGDLFNPGITLAVAGQVITNVDQSGLRVSFHAVRTMTATPDFCDVSVYNLGDVGKTAIQAFFDLSGSAPLILSVGYGGVLTQLFSGSVRSMTARVALLPDVLTRFVADDGGDAMAEARAPSSTIGLSPINMVDVAIVAMNALPTTIVPIVAHPSVAATFALSTVAQQAQVYTAVSIGRAWDLVVEAARAMGARAWIRDGQIHMTKRGLPSDQVGLGVLLPRSHWLTEPEHDGAGVVKISAYMDPSLVPGRIVTIVGRTAPASAELHRIEVAEYSGDTGGGSPWAVNLTLKAIA